MVKGTREEIMSENKTKEEKKEKRTRRRKECFIKVLGRKVFYVQPGEELTRSEQDKRKADLMKKLHKEYEYAMEHHDEFLKMLGYDPETHYVVFLDGIPISQDNFKAHTHNRSIQPPIKIGYVYGCISYRIYDYNVYEDIEKIVNSDKPFARRKRSY